MRSRKVKRTASRKLTLSLSVVVVLGAAGFYLSQVTDLLSKGFDSKAALAAVDLVRALPSTQEGLTVDEVMAKQLEESRQSGNLASYQGWITRPISWKRTRVLVVFSFEEKDNKPRSAEWVVDMGSNTITPQNELAASVYKR